MARIVTRANGSTYLVQDPLKGAVTPGWYVDNWTGGAVEALLVQYGLVHYRAVWHDRRPGLKVGIRTLPIKRFRKRHRRM